MTKRLLTATCLLLVAAGLAGAQDALRTLSARLAKEVAAFGYSYTTKGTDTPFKGDGKAIVSGSCYRIQGNGLDIRCDGSVRWTADPAAGEMVIEDAAGQALDFLSNPALLVADLEGNFKVAGTSTSDGRKTYMLEPLNEPSIISLALVLEKDIPVAATLKMKDGSVVDFTVSGFTLAARQPESVWNFGKEELSKYKTVTDLR